MDSESVSLISEGTSDPFYQRTMERLEEKLRRGETDVTFDTYEALHLFSRLIALERDRRHLQEMLYRTFKGYSDHFNLIVNKVPEKP